MNRTQIVLLLIGCTALALVLLFPFWSTSNGRTKIDLGWSWILSPPEGVRANDFEAPSTSEWSDKDRERMRGHAAASFGEPEINWVIQGYLLVGVLAPVIVGVFSARDRRPRSTAA